MPFTVSSNRIWNVLKLRVPPRVQVCWRPISTWDLTKLKVFRPRDILLLRSLSSLYSAIALMFLPVLGVSWAYPLLHVSILLSFLLLLLMILLLLLSRLLHATATANFTATAADIVTALLPPLRLPLLLLPLLPSLLILTLLQPLPQPPLLFGLLMVLTTAGSCLCDCYCHFYCYRYCHPTTAITATLKANMLDYILTCSVALEKNSQRDLAGSFVPNMLVLRDPMWLVVLSVTS